MNKLYKTLLLDPQIQTIPKNQKVPEVKELSKGKKWPEVKRRRPMKRRDRKE
jgi:hypothetical protein